MNFSYNIVGWHMEDILTEISIYCKQFQHQGNQDRFICMLSAGIEAVEHVAEFICKNRP